LEFCGAHLIQAGPSNDYSGTPGAIPACCDYDLRGCRLLWEGIACDLVREVTRDMRSVGVLNRDPIVDRALKGLLTAKIFLGRLDGDVLSKN
jgi:hypothetical protein